MLLKNLYLLFFLLLIVGGFGFRVSTGFGFGFELSPKMVFGAVSGFEFGFQVRVREDSTRSESASASLPS
jgi:hypothetical protein